MSEDMHESANEWTTNDDLGAHAVERASRTAETMAPAEVAQTSEDYWALVTALVAAAEAWRDRSDEVTRTALREAVDAWRAGGGR